MKDKKNKKQLIISIVAIVLIVVLIVTATYAYFASQTGDPASTDIKITTATVDSLTFSTGDEISLSATQSNFGTGESSLSDSTTATATLVPNNSTNSAEATYYLYVKISNNDFSYTTDDSTAELVLSITGPDGEVTSLSGLSYTTVTDNQGTSYSGFDVTTKTGLIAIAELYSIVADGDAKVDDWTVTLTFVNLSTDQSQNAGASFEAGVIIQENKDLSLYSLLDVCSSGDTFSNCIRELYNETGEGTVNLYYFDGEGDYTNSSYEAVDYSYRYAGGDYALTGTATNAGYSTISNTSSSGTTGFVYFYCNGSKSYVGKDCNSSFEYYYTLAYESEATQYSTYQEALDQAVSDGYLTSDNVKNYVCFGSDSETCESENLYRIIGFFLNDAGEYEMKIIKADYADTTLLGTDGDYSKAYTSDAYSGNKDTTTNRYAYYWSYKNYSASYYNSGYYNDWSYSYLNTVNLNTNYYGSLDSIWQNMISEHIWIVGGNTYANIYSTTVNNTYSNEIVNYVTNQYADGYSGTVASTYTSNVGLMYVSDYGYAALPTYWTTVLSLYSSAKDSNWLYNGVWEWTISRYSSSNSYYAFYVHCIGNVGSNIVNGGDAVRPTLYLVSSTSIISGSGTQSDPYRIQT